MVLCVDVSASSSLPVYPDPVLKDTAVPSTTKALLIKASHMQRFLENTFQERLGPCALKRYRYYGLKGIFNLTDTPNAWQNMPHLSEKRLRSFWAVC